MTFAPAWHRIADCQTRRRSHRPQPVVPWPGRESAPDALRVAAAGPRAGDGIGKRCLYRRLERAQLVAHGGLAVGGTVASRPSSSASSRRQTWVDVVP